MLSKSLATLSLSLILIGNASGIEVYVQPLDGKAIQFDVKPSDEIDALKTKIENSQSIEIDDQLLYFENQLLDNFKTFNDYKIVDGSTVLLFATSPEDNDGDNWENETEDLFDSSKEDPFSAPKHQIKIKLSEPGKVIVMFPGEKGSFYSLERSRNLVGWFAPRILLIGNGKTFQFSHSISDGTFFWRVRKS
jgi:hypothetical protein